MEIMMMMMTKCRGLDRKTEVLAASGMAYGSCDHAAGFLSPTPLCLRGTIGQVTEVVRAYWRL